MSHVRVPCQCQCQEAVVSDWPVSTLRMTHKRKIYGEGGVENTLLKCVLEIEFNACCIFLNFSQGIIFRVSVVILSHVQTFRYKFWSKR